MKKLLATFGICAAVTAGVVADGRTPIVETALVDGIIHPVTSEFMRSAIARADADGAALIVFTLHTPGGLLDSTRDINNAIIAAKTPVAVFVGPAGYRAASARAEAQKALALDPASADAKALLERANRGELCEIPGC